MSRWIIFAGIAAMLVTGYYATFFERGEGFLRSVKFIPAKLQKQVEAALQDGGAPWVQVQMNGQKAVLSGLAPSELDRADAIEVARHAAGRGGTWWGGVTKVDGEQIRLAPPQKPYAWTATLGDRESLRLQGFVPGSGFRKIILAEARKLFHGTIEDQTVVASGQPTGDWLATVLLGLQQLKRLANGEVHFDEATIKVLGQATDAGVLDQVSAAMQSVKPPYAGVAEVVLTGAVRSSETDDNSSAAPVAGAPVQRLAAADCPAIINKAMKSNVIRFESGAADLSAAGVKVLESMTRTAMSCSDLKLRISGYTDGTAQEPADSNLSRKRANVVAKYIREHGVEADRLVVVAAGSSDAASPDDAAANRRVEFSVIP